MPVTFKPGKVDVSPVNDCRGIVSSARLFSRGCYPGGLKCLEHLQSSFSDITSDSHIYASSNGFVSAVIASYSWHHHLIIRPDDVWIAILTQFSTYVNRNAEELRKLFVAHEEWKELVVG